MEHAAAIRMLRSIAAAFDGHDLDGIPRPLRRRRRVRVAAEGRTPGVSASPARLRSARRSPAASRGSRTSATRTTITSRTVNAAPLSGPYRGRPLRASKSKYRGCDLWTLRDGKVVKKDSYWKIRTTD